MDMKKTDRMMKLNVVWDIQHVIGVDLILQVDVILAVDVIDVEDLLDRPHIGGLYCFTERPINIHLFFTFLEIHK